MKCVATCAVLLQWCLSCWSCHGFIPLTTTLSILHRSNCPQVHGSPATTATSVLSPRSNDDFLRVLNSCSTSRMAVKSDQTEFLSTSKSAEELEQQARRTRNSKIAMELLGTSILVMTIQLAVGRASVFAPLTIGSMLIAIIYGGAPISGAHYNPAVSLMFRLQGKLSSLEMIQYWLSQFTGGYLGAILGGIIGGTYSGISVGSNYSFLQALLAEVVFTFILGLVILNVAIHPAAEGNQYYGLAIGLFVIGGATAVGGISGAVFNPAVAVGLCAATKALKNIPYVVSVMLANFIGGATASVAFDALVPSKRPSTKSE